MRRFGVLYRCTCVIALNIRRIRIHVDIRSGRKRRENLAGVVGSRYSGADTRWGAVRLSLSVVPSLQREDGFRTGGYLRWGVPYS